MSADQSTTQDLVKLAEDGKEGYAKGATELSGGDRPELATTFTTYSQQRAGFSRELQALAATYGDTLKETGSTAATLHRGWLSVRDKLTGSGPESIIKTAVQGEDHAIDGYEKALKQEDISADVRTMAQKHLTEIKAARAELDRLLAAEK